MQSLNPEFQSTKYTIFNLDEQNRKTKKEIGLDLHSALIHRVLVGKVVDNDVMAIQSTVDLIFEYVQKPSLLKEVHAGRKVQTIPVDYIHILIREMSTIECAPRF